MSTAIAQSSPQALLTAAEFARRYSNGYVELIDGVVQELPVPHQNHGEVCFRMSFALGLYLQSNDSGCVTTNDSFVQTKVNPDRVRGADVCYFSYERLPKGPMADGILSVAPDLVVEVRSPSERWNSVFAKVSEYLSADVCVVVVLDMPTASASVYRNDEFQQIFDNGDDLVLPDVLPEFKVPVRKLFE